MKNETPVEMAMRPPPLVVKRVLNAPQSLVFKAFGHESHIRRWFSPEGCSCPEAEVDFRVGGAFNVVIQLPDGTRHSVRAAFAEIAPPERERFVGVVESGGVERFRVDTRVALAAVGERTELTVTQAYEIYDPEFLNAVAGSREGWRTTLDKLEREVERLQAAPPRSVVHGDFTIRRVFATTPERLYQAFTDAEAKAKWFVGPEGWRLLERAMDVRAGGRERAKGQLPHGLTTTFDAIYLDVIANERLIYAYEMRLDGVKISASLASLTFAPDPRGAHLTLTEQGAFLDGYDDAGNREKGTQALLDAVERSLSAP